MQLDGAGRTAMVELIRSRPQCRLPFGPRPVMWYPRASRLPAVGVMSTLPFHRWTPQLRRAVMRARPEFFAWSVERQERYAVDIPKEDRARLNEALLAELFGRRYATPGAAAAAADDLPLDEQNIWNATVLPLYGIGEDCFVLNESFADGRSMLDFETLRDFDRRGSEPVERGDDAAEEGRVAHHAKHQEVRARQAIMVLIHVDEGTALHGVRQLRVARIGDEPEGAPLDDLHQVEEQWGPLRSRIRASEAVDHQRIARQVELDAGRRALRHVLEVGGDMIAAREYST